MRDREGEVEMEALKDSVGVSETVLVEVRVLVAVRVLLRVSELLREALTLLLGEVVEDSVAVAETLGVVLPLEEVEAEEEALLVMDFELVKDTVGVWLEYMLSVVLMVGVLEKLAEAVLVREIVGVLVALLELLAELDTVLEGLVEGEADRLAVEEGDLVEDSEAVLVQLLLSVLLSLGSGVWLVLGVGCTLRVRLLLLEAGTGVLLLGGDLLGL